MLEFTWSWVCRRKSDFRPPPSCRALPELTRCCSPASSWAALWELGKQLLERFMVQSPHGDACPYEPTCTFLDFCQMVHVLLIGMLEKLGAGCVPGCSPAPPYISWLASSTLCFDGGCTEPLGTTGSQGSSPSALLQLTFSALKET